MTIAELIEKLRRALNSRDLAPEDRIFFRDHSVTDSAMEAGSNGYQEVEEALLIYRSDELDDGVYLIAGEVGW